MIRPFPVTGPNGEPVGRLDLTEAAVDAIEGLPDAWELRAVTRINDEGVRTLVEFSLHAIPVVPVSGDQEGTSG